MIPQTHLKRRSPLMVMSSVLDCSHTLTLPRAPPVARTASRGNTPGDHVTPGAGTADWPAVRTHGSSGTSPSALSERG